MADVPILPPLSLGDLVKSDGPTPRAERPAHPLDCRFYPRAAEGEGLICECKRFPGLMCGRVCQYAKKRGNAARADEQGTLL